MCVDYNVDNVDSVEKKLRIMFMGNRKTLEKHRKIACFVELCRSIM